MHAPRDEGRFLDSEMRIIIKMKLHRKNKKMKKRGNVK